MKKIYFLFIFVFSLQLSSSFAQAPQCQFDYAWLALGKNGVFPDSATNFVSGIVGQPYIQNVTIKVPYDTTDATLGTVHFAHIDLQTNITNPVNYGLPPGLSLAGTPSNLKFPGNDTSCMVIYGTPTVAGTYYLSFTLKTWIQEVTFVPVNTQTLTYYKIDILPAGTGINEAEANVFAVGQNIPNPFSGKTRINYSVPQEGKASFALYNMLGKAVIEKKYEAHRGANEIEINSRDLAEGIYFYTIEFNNKTITKRMIVGAN
jgi:hypothetical protein